MGSLRRTCSCSDGQVLRYRARVSGPLLDRLDLHVAVPSVSWEELAEREPGESSACVRERAVAARARQLARQGLPNALLPRARLERLCELEESAAALLADAIDRLGFSARAHDRVLRLALTIRDLACTAGGEPRPASGCERLDVRSIAEALSYRFVDRAPTGGGLGWYEGSSVT